MAVEVTLFAVAFAVSVPAVMFLAIAVWVAFLVSIPARGHEAVLSPGTGGTVEGASSAAEPETRRGR